VETLHLLRSGNAHAAHVDIVLTTSMPLTKETLPLLFRLQYCDAAVVFLVLTMDTTSTTAWDRAARLCCQLCRTLARRIMRGFLVLVDISTQRVWIPFRSISYT
jgi:hypothetical protein